MLTRSDSTLSCILILLLSFISIPGTALAQNSGSPASNYGFSFSTGNENSIDNNLYIDQLGLKLITEVPPLEDFINSETYILGPYDMLTVNIQGSRALQLRGITVNAQGDLELPYIGKVPVKNLTIDKTQKKLQRLFSESFKDINVHISLDSPRPVFVHVAGDIPKPGKYILPAGTRADIIVNSGMNLVKEKDPESDKDNTSVQPDVFRMSKAGSYRSLQPTEFLKTQSPSTGSEALKSKINQYRQVFNLRNIRIHRNDSTTINADLVSYLRTGNLKDNPYLRDGDIINIDQKSPSTPRISISGAVNAPIEMAYNKTDNIQKLLKIAGSYQTNADTTRFYVYRSTSNEKIVVDQSVVKNYSLHPNDRVVVPYFNQGEQKSASAWISGQVNAPGNFPINEGVTTIGDILDDAGGLNDEALPTAAYLVRNATDDRNVKPPVSFSPTELSRSSDLFLQGFDYLKLEEALGANRVPIDLSDKQSFQNFKLSDGDHLYIPKNYHTVILFGQVNNPGYYKYDQNLSYQDYIQKAEGLTIAANHDRIYIIKAGSKAWVQPNETKINSGDIIFVDRQPFEDFTAHRDYKIRQSELKRNNFRIILSTVSTITAIVTTYIALTK